MSNYRNNLVTREYIQSVLNHYGPIGDNGEPLTVKNIEIYRKAFVHESYYQASKNPQTSLDTGPTEILVPSESNQRLEYLGDNILKGVMAKYLYKNFPKHREGFMSIIKMRLEDSSTLSRIAIELGFKKYLLLSDEVESQTILGLDLGRNKSSYYEDAFEAFIGAIAEDSHVKGDPNQSYECGLVYATRFATRVIQNEIDFVEFITRNDNFKGALQRFHQKNKWNLPEYIKLTEDSTSFEKEFIVGIFSKEPTSNPDTNVTFEKETDNLEQYTKRILTRVQGDKDLYTKIYNGFFEDIKDHHDEIAEIEKEIQRLEKKKEMLQNMKVCKDKDKDTRKSNKLYLVGLGKANKMAKAQQEAAKIALENYNLDPYTVEFK